MTRHGSILTVVPDLVLAEEELVERGQLVQVLNPADLVVAQLQHLQAAQRLQVLDLGDLV